MPSFRIACRVGLAALLSASPVGTWAQSSITVPLEPYSYRTVNAAPFNGQLAFYAPELSSPLTIQIVIGNGRRPFAADVGSMRPQEFTAYVTKLTGAKVARVIPFRISKRGESLTFQYLLRSYTVTATDLRADRIVLTLK